MFQFYRNTEVPHLSPIPIETNRVPHFWPMLPEVGVLKSRTEHVGTAAFGCPSSEARLADFPRKPRPVPRSFHGVENGQRARSELRQ